MATTTDLQDLVIQLKAVAHPLRLRVLALLAAGELCVCQVAETLEEPQSSVSEALRELRRAGLVVERKEGRWVYVAVAPTWASMPLLKGILTEATPLRETLADRRRAEEVRSLALPVVCDRNQPVAPPQKRKVTRG